MSLKIVIVGLGLIGGSLAKAMTGRADCRVYGVDRNQDILRQAENCGAIAGSAGENDLSDADFLFLCTYPQAAVEYVERNGAKIGKNCVVTDACGIKSAVCPRLKELSQKFGFSFVGGHPMAGKERSGFAASEAELFDGASYILVPCGPPDFAVERLRRLVMQLGFRRTVIATPEHHDEMIAFTSQVPHALACAYVMSPRCPEHPGFSAGSYRDVSRVARINEILWSELFLENQDALSRELDTLIENLDQINTAVKSGDQAKLQELLRRGREIKEALGE